MKQDGGTYHDPNEDTDSPEPMSAHSSKARKGQLNGSKEHNHNHEHKDQDHEHEHEGDHEDGEDSPEKTSEENLSPAATSTHFHAALALRLAPERLSVLQQGRDFGGSDSGACSVSSYSGSGEASEDEELARPDREPKTKTKLRRKRGEVEPRPHGMADALGDNDCTCGAEGEKSVGELEEMERRDKSMENIY